MVNEVRCDGMGLAEMSVATADLTSSSTSTTNITTLWNFTSRQQSIHRLLCFSDPNQRNAWNGADTARLIAQCLRENVRVIVVVMMQRQTRPFQYLRVTVVYFTSIPISYTIPFHFAIIA
jgi:hypothetical protein